MPRIFFENRTIFRNSLLTLAVLGALSIQLQTRDAMAQTADTPSAQTELLRSDQAIDRTMGAFNDPVILQQRLQQPAEWPAPRTLPPYGQRPLNEGPNFCVLYPNNCK